VSECFSLQDQLMRARKLQASQMKCFEQREMGAHYFRTEAQSKASQLAGKMDARKWPFWLAA